jgi:catechol 2,3-dioxygenase-like lactoylglutathione lyase family enzyme
VRDVEYADATVHGKATSFKARFGFAQAGPVQIELIQPLEGQTIYDEHLATKGEGLHHLGFLVPDMEERVAEMAKRGVGVLQSGRIGRSSGFAYLDTSKSAGVILEYIKASPGMVKYFESVKQLGKSNE